MHHAGKRSISRHFWLIGGGYSGSGAPFFDSKMGRMTIVRYHSGIKGIKGIEGTKAPRAPRISWVGLLIPFFIVIDIVARNRNRNRITDLSTFYWDSSFHLHSCFAFSSVLAEEARLVSEIFTSRQRSEEVLLPLLLLPLLLLLLLLLASLPPPPPSPPDSFEQPIKRHGRHPIGERLWAPGRICGRASCFTRFCASKICPFRAIAHIPGSDVSDGTVFYPAMVKEKCGERSHTGSSASGSKPSDGTLIDTSSWLELVPIVGHLSSPSIFSCSC